MVLVEERTIDSSAPRMRSVCQCSLESLKVFSGIKARMLRDLTNHCLSSNILETYKTDGTDI